jgi:DNA-binding CsgD family transcriptional regulator
MLHITPAERAALQLLADGKTTNEIARRLRIAEPAVGTQLAALYARMGVVTQAEAIATASRRGLLGIASHGEPGRSSSPRAVRHSSVFAAD